MKRHSHTAPEKKGTGKIAFQGGSYALAISALFLALLIAVNILAGALPASITKIDTSSSQLYSITSNTKSVVNNLQQDVSIYWITQAGKEDDILENLLNKYDALSEHISVIKKNPDIYPTFAQQYTEEPVKNNSLVVECGSRNRFIGFDDIYLTQPDMSSYSVEASFDGEGAITSAIDYVVNAEQPIIYSLEGHGEPELPEAFQNQLTKANMELKPLSLLNVDTIPEDAACVMLYAPASDLSQEEVEILHSYAEQGGKLLVIAGPAPEDDLDVLYSLLSEYGITAEDGIVVEQDRAHYAFRVPYVLMPFVSRHDITAPLLDEHYYPILPIARGMRISQTPVNAVINELLTTSETSFSNPDGYHLDSYEKGENDPQGPFTVGVSIECGQEGQIVWFSSSQILDDMYNAYSSGGNVDMVMNSLASMVGESESMAIRSKSLNYNYLTISESTSSLLKVILIGVFPLLFLGVGIFVVLRRRARFLEPEKHDAV